jgi:hypothetical protein
MLIGLVGALPSYCQDQPAKEEIKTVEGEIVAKDTQALTINVKWLKDVEEEEYDEDTFSVPEDTPIISGAGNIGFSTLDMGNRVIIDYYEDSFDVLVAKKITIKKE